MLPSDNVRVDLFQSRAVLNCERRLCVRLTQRVNLIVRAFALRPLSQDHRGPTVPTRRPCIPYCRSTALGQMAPCDSRDPPKVVPGAEIGKKTIFDLLSIVSRGIEPHWSHASRTGTMPLGQLQRAFIAMQATLRHVA